MASEDPPTFNHVLTEEDFDYNLVHYDTFSILFLNHIRYVVCNGGNVAYLAMNVIIVKGYRVEDDAFRTDRYIPGFNTYE